MRRDPTISCAARATRNGTDRARQATGAARHGLFLLLACIGAARAETPVAPQKLSPRISWRIASVRIEGADHVSKRDLQPLLSTRQRSFFTPWKARPRFDREGLADDV